MRVQWEFESDLKDSLGVLHGNAHGSARVENGALVLGVESYVETAALPIDVKEKTLEAWVLLANLKQRGGSALTLQTRNGVPITKPRAYVHTPAEHHRFFWSMARAVRSGSDFEWWFLLPEHGESCAFWF